MGQTQVMSIRTHPGMLRTWLATMGGPRSRHMSRIAHNRGLIPVGREESLASSRNTAFRLIGNFVLSAATQKSRESEDHASHIKMA
jgi:hypothetical protein